MSTFILSLLLVALVALGMLMAVRPTYERFVGTAADTAPAAPAAPGLDTNTILSAASAVATGAAAALAAHPAVQQKNSAIAAGKDAQAGMSTPATQVATANGGQAMIGTSGSGVNPPATSAGAVVAPLPAAAASNAAFIPGQNFTVDSRGNLVLQKGSGMLGPGGQNQYPNASTAWLGPGGLGPPSTWNQATFNPNYSPPPMSANGQGVFNPNTYGPWTPDAPNPYASEYYPNEGGYRREWRRERRRRDDKEEEEETGCTKNNCKESCEDAGYIKMDEVPCYNCTLP